MHTRFIYIIISTLAAAGADFLAKFLFREHHGLTVGGYLVASWLIEIVVLLIYVVVRRGDEASAMYAMTAFWGLLVVTVIARLLGNVLYYKGMRRLDASLVTVLFTFSTIISVGIGIVIHGESLSRMKLIGVACTILSIVLVYSHISWKKKELILFGCVLGSALLYGVQMNIEKVVGLQFDPFVFRLWYSMLSVFSLLLLYRHDITHDLKYIKHASFWMYNCVSAGLFFLVNIGMYFAFSAGAEAGKVDAINNLGVFVIIALEVIMFREHDRLWIKIIAGLLSCLGVWMLYVW